MAGLRHPPQFIEVPRRFPESFTLALLAHPLIVLNPEIVRCEYDESDDLTPALTPLLYPNYLANRFFDPLNFL